MIHEHAPFDSMYSIDDGGHHRYPEFAANWDTIGSGGRTGRDDCASNVAHRSHLKADSHSEAARVWLQTHVNEIDVAFIDGDHSYEGAWQDVELCLPLLHTGALIIFHDTIACEGVARVWSRGTQEGRWAPVAHYCGSERTLGIGVGMVL